MEEYFELKWLIDNWGNVRTQTKRFTLAEEEEALVAFAKKEARYGADVTLNRVRVECVRRGVSR